MISSQTLEGSLGSTWNIEATVDTVLAVDVGLEWRLTRFGEEVLVLTRGAGITVPDNAAKVAFVTVSPAAQEAAGATAGVHEYRLRLTKAGAVLDEASGIFYVRD